MHYLSNDIISFCTRLIKNNYVKKTSKTKSPGTLGRARNQCMKREEEGGRMKGVKMSKTAEGEGELK